MFITPCRRLYSGLESYECMRLKLLQIVSVINFAYHFVYISRKLLWYVVRCSD
jgi:hypothetical protein